MAGVLNQAYVQKQTIGQAAAAAAPLAVGEMSLRQAFARGAGMTSVLASGAYSEDGRYTSYYAVGDPIGTTASNSLPIAP
jgi:hypothetical protein